MHILNAALLCPCCHAPLAVNSTAATCECCGVWFGVDNEIVDLEQRPNDSPGGQRFMESSDVVRKYEEVTRRTFIRVMGQNWSNALNYDQEDEYLLTSLGDARGPILDIACGAGRWTAVIRKKFGPGVVVGLDLSVPMLHACRALLPDVSLVRANALALPFGDGSMGAAVCWNALQLLPKPAIALKEAARVLRTGGTLTCFTYRRSPHALYAHFQNWFAQTLTVRTFPEDEIIRMARDAGLTDIVISGPECSLMLTARKGPPPQVGASMNL